MVVCDRCLDGLHERCHGTCSCPRCRVTAPARFVGVGRRTLDHDEAFFAARARTTEIMRRNGATVRECAAAFGVSTTTLYKMRERV